MTKITGRGVLGGRVQDINWELQECNQNVALIAVMLPVQEQQLVKAGLAGRVIAT